MTMLPDADALADQIAAGLFTHDADVRKKNRAALAAHANPGVAAFFAADKRSYHAISDGAKLFKTLKEFDALGIHGARVAIARLKALSNVPAHTGIDFSVQPVLDAALRYPGQEEAAFEALAAMAVVLLPKVKKALPRGLSRLRALTTLHVEGEVTSGDNIRELLEVPQRFMLVLRTKRVDLAHWLPIAERLSGLALPMGREAPLDGATLARFAHLEHLDVTHTALTELAGLGALTLRVLRVGENKVSDLTPIAGMTSLVHLDLHSTQVADLGPVAGLVALETLSFSHAPVRDLSALRGLSSLRHLSLMSTRVDSFEPLVGLPLESLDLPCSVPPDLAVLARIPTLRRLDLVGVPADATGLAALRSARPELFPTG